MDTNNQSHIETGSNKLWALIGKIGIIVTIFISIHTVYKWFKPDGAQIKATLFEGEYDLAPDIYAVLRMYAHYPNETNIQIAFSNSVLSSLTDTRVPTNFASILANQFNLDKFNNPVFDYNVWGHYS